MEINTKFIPREPGIYLVGGTVRDALLGGEPTDFDIAAGPPCGGVARRIAEKAGSRVAAIGKSGACVYRIVAGNLRFDIAPIQGGSIEADLQRRDFTVNAMAWDLYRQKLLDPAGGQSDLQRQCIRMLGEDNLLADPLRMLRAYRLAAALGFRLERQTKAAIRRHARRITEAAGERIRDELMKMLACRRSLPCLREMDAAGLLTAVFPELQALKDCRQNNRHAFNAFSHTLEAFSHLEHLLLAPENTGTGEYPLPAGLFSAREQIKLCLLLHDIGKPACRSIDPEGGIHFHRHEKRGAAMAVSISRRLRLSKKEEKFLHFMIGRHGRPLSLFAAHRAGQLTRRGLVRFFGKTHPFTADLLVHAMADSRGKKAGAERDAFERFCRQLLEAYCLDFSVRIRAAPLITGHDLIQQCGLTPSPLFATLLSRVEEERLTGRLRTKDEALAWVTNFLKTNKLS